MNKDCLNKSIETIFHKTTGTRYLKGDTIVKVAYGGCYPTAIKESIYAAFVYNLTDDPAMDIIKEAAVHLEREGFLSFDM